MFTELLCPCMNYEVMNGGLVLMSNYCVTASYYSILLFILLHFLFINLTTAAAHEEITTGGQIRGVGDSDQQTLSK